MVRHSAGRCVWLEDYEAACSSVDMSLMDERFVKAMEGTASFLTGRRSAFEKARRAKRPGARAFVFR